MKEHFNKEFYWRALDHTISCCWRINAWHDM